MIYKLDLSIDGKLHDFLLKIPSHVKMLEQLMADYSVKSMDQQNHGALHMFGLEYFYRLISLPSLLRQMIVQIVRK